MKLKKEINRNGKKETARKNINKAKRIILYLISFFFTDSSTFDVFVVSTLFTLRSFPANPFSSLLHGAAATAATT